MSPSYHAITRRKLPGEIADQIEQLILTNQLAVGSPLPPERTLAQQLQVSRNALREAIRVLEQKGLVVVRPGSGTYVAEPTPQVLREPLGILVQLNTRHLFELIEARKAIEVEVAGLTAERATPEDLEQIGHWLNEMEEHFDLADSYTEADVAFHAALAKAAKNEVLRVILDSMRDALRQNIKILVLRHPTAKHDAMRYHRLIFQALKEKSSEKARKAMSEHLEVVAQDLRDLQEQNLLARS
jgi:GntR family transcriptional repressor for pyruvate dehydrogenase complex